MASVLEDCSKTVGGIRNDLICQVCEGHARPGERRWYRCMNLHQICRDCQGKEENCSCGQPISLEYCKIIEQLLSVEGMKFNCINAKNGCQETFFENGLGNHESECIFRQVSCLGNALWKTGCNNEIIFRDVIQHYENQHLKTRKPLVSIDVSKIEQIRLNELGLSGRDCFRDPSMIILNNQTFLLNEKTIDKLIYKWVYILGSPSEAKHYSYTLKLAGKETEITFKGKVASIDESFDTLFEAGKCFAIPHKALIAQLVDEDKKYEYSLEIRNLKEEVKDENYESGISDNDEEDAKE